ncbi:integumentary mucin A.1-like isoform X2 [Stegastes partitus]|nr:PREDICTED: integumentary mucin A.1-like isoform X2 [Stegastes partitus]
MAIDTSVATLACCLLALSFAVPTTENNALSITTPSATTDFNLTQVTTVQTSHLTDTADFTEDVTENTATTVDSGTFTKTTAATTENTSQAQTPQSTTILPPLTNSAPLETTIPTTQTPTLTALTTQVIQTTAGNTRSPDTPAITTESSSFTTSGSVDRTSKGSDLNTSEKSMTIVFSVVLGVFMAALLMFVFHKCKQKLQFMHQPLHNTDEFVADDDTLVISGGLYDGHPIYDNVPSAPGDQSQFRLEFI